METKQRKFKKKSRKKVARSEDTGEWIISYADTVTLLLCFFVIFYAEEKKKTENNLIKELSLEIQKSKMEKKDTDKKTGTSKDTQVKELNDSLKAGLNETDGRKLNFVKESRKNEILIRLYEKDFFEVGDFNLKNDGRELIARVTEILKPFQNKIYVRLEGHTDSLKVSRSAFYKTNLNLSSLRASEAAQVFLDSGFNEDRLRVVGFGASRPLVNDRAPATENSKSEYLPKKGERNRRVELRIIVGEVNFDRALKAQDDLIESESLSE